MAYGVIKKKRRLVNPGRRRMTAKQIRFFGTKRQRAALKAGRKRHRNTSVRSLSKLRRRAPTRAAIHTQGSIGRTMRSFRKLGRATRARKRSRRKNVSSILVASIPGLNPGGRKGKVTKAARRRAGLKAARTRSRRRAARRNRRPHTHRNPGRRYRTRTKVVTRYRRSRHHNPRHRRRNPGMFGGAGGNDITAVAGIISGAALTRLLTGFVPAQYNTGVPGYIITAIAAVVQGQAVGKVLKKPAFGKYMTWGGFTYLGLRIVNDLIPSLSSYLPFGLQGMGLLSPTDGFPLPSVPLFGSMGNFKAPRFLAPAVMAAKASGLHGVGTFSNSSMRIGRVQ